MNGTGFDSPTKKGDKLLSRKLIVRDGQKLDTHKAREKCGNCKETDIHEGIFNAVKKHSSIYKDPLSIN